MLRGEAGGFEEDDGFAGLGVAEAFAGETFDGFGIVLKIADVGLEFLFPLFFGFDLVFEREHVLAEGGVLFEDREIPEKDAEQAGGDDQHNDELREPMPDSQVYFFTQRCFI